ncbi:hypothetical protein ACMHYB_33610 [Sorangium sp. So ce1128]
MQLTTSRYSASQTGSGVSHFETQSSAPQAMSAASVQTRSQAEAVCEPDPGSFSESSPPQAASRPNEIRNAHEEIHQNRITVLQED